mmetsp:Transcript_11449/g.13064  ORF Transcript_11449/g.13064 Transcript_11449/m.13064 type:complete len:85 (+) Transcript_11449:78-332(+)
MMTMTTPIFSTRSKSSWTMMAAQVLACLQIPAALPPPGKAADDIIFIHGTHHDRGKKAIQARYRGSNIIYGEAGIKILVQRLGR